MNTKKVEPAQPVEAVDVRTAFERWAKYAGFDVSPEKDGNYKARDTYHAWIAWQAALAHPRPTGDVAAKPKVHDAAYVAGEQAYSYGSTFDHSNPYEKGTEGWSQWRRGWIAAASGKDLSEPEGDTTAPTGDRKPCPGCNGDRGGLGPNMGYVPCDDCDGNGFIESDDDASPTGEQAGEVVGVVKMTVGGWGAAILNEAGKNLPSDTKLYAQPRPVGVPDGWKLVESDALPPGYTLGSDKKDGSFWPLFESNYIDHAWYATKPEAEVAAWRDAHARLTHYMDSVRRFAMLAAAPAPGKGGEA